MKKVPTSIIYLMLVPLPLLWICACAQTASMAAWHPGDLSKTLMCSDCHAGTRAALNHTSDFGTRHRFYAEQQSRVCAVCHKESFCSDCHAHKEELKPSDKHKGSPELSLPHRGDYLTQHMIDGRINPAACMKCHGRQNNERCIACHR